MRPPGTFIQTRGPVRALSTTYMEVSVDHSWDDQRGGYQAIFEDHGWHLTFSPIGDSSGGDTGGSHWVVLQCGKRSVSSHLARNIQIWGFP